MINTLQDNIKRQKRLLDAIEGMSNTYYWDTSNNKYRRRLRRCLKNTVKNFKRLNIVILKQTEAEIRKQVPCFKF